MTLKLALGVSPSIFECFGCKRRCQVDNCSLVTQLFYVCLGVFDLSVVVSLKPSIVVDVVRSSWCLVYCDCEGTSDHYLSRFICYEDMVVFSR